MGSDLTNSPDPLHSKSETGPKAANGHPLRREVFYPQAQNTGVGVMLVASAAMFFAVASSAFILRAQMPQRACPHANANSITLHALPIDYVAKEVIAETVETCGEPYYEENADGTVSVFFDLCPVP